MGILSREATLSFSPFVFFLNEGKLNKKGKLLKERFFPLRADPNYKGFVTHGGKQEVTNVVSLYKMPKRPTVA